MSDDKNLQISVPGERPPIITLLAPAGHGKTCLAASFPNPIFIRTEDGMQAIPEDKRPPAYPKATSAQILLDQVAHLCRLKGHDFKTAVLDTVTPLDSMFIDHVIANDKNNPRSINQALGGYGAGMKAVAALHQRLAKMLQYLNEKRGMTVVICAHSEIVRLDPPDTEGYTKYGIRLAKDSLAPWVDQVDMVAFIQLVKIIKGEDGKQKKAKSSGDLEIVVHASAANESKNRYGIEEKLDYPKGTNPLMAVIPYYEKAGLYTPVEKGRKSTSKPKPAAAAKPADDLDAFLEESNAKPDDAVELPDQAVEQEQEQEQGAELSDQDREFFDDIPL